jgi:GrpB-like predicted nucleotidyltransferase (UPF0157 family)
MLEPMQSTNRPLIVDHDPSWPQRFAAVAADLRAALGDRASVVEHVGSTAVPGLAAKDVVDVQVEVAGDDDLDPAAEALAGAGWQVTAFHHDHHVAGLPQDPDQWTKRFARSRTGHAVHVHVRVAGRANTRYAVLFRDYLRTHPATAASYAEAKRRLAALCPDTITYAEVKDPVVDLVYLAAEEWAAGTGWTPGASMEP